MPKSREEKRNILFALKEKIEKSKSVIFASYGALNVKKSEELRNEIKKEGGECYVPKKTLLNLAFKDQKIEGVDVKNFKGRIAVLFGYTDEVAPAKVASKFKEDTEDKIDFLGGVLENKFINAEEVASLAKLPSKQELYAKIVGSMNAPVSGFVNVLAGNIRGLVNVLKAIEEKK